MVSPRIPPADRALQPLRPRPPSCRIVVPLNPQASQQLAERALDQGVPIRSLVLAALAGIGIPVTPRQMTSRNRIHAHLSGRRRSNTNGYCVTAVLPPSTFKHLHAVAEAQGVTIVHLVRSALAASGYPIDADELIVDRRRSGWRRPRRHYASRDGGKP